MKRYKVVEPIKVEHPDAKGFEAIIPAGTEICLEEVEERACKLCRRSLRDGHYCGTGTFRGDWGGNTTTIDQPKEEKEILLGWDKAENVSCNVYGFRKKDGTVVATKIEYKDQPLTPKDVGMTKAKAMNFFLSWLHLGDKSYFKLSDEEFDRLYQEFLKEKLTNK